MRINQQQRVMTNGVRRSDGSSVRSARLGIDVFFLNLFLRGLRISIERLQLVEIYFVNVSTNAAFTESQSHPRLEPLDDSRLHIGMLRQVEVQAVGPRVH